MVARRLPIAAAALVSVALLAGACSGDDGSGGPGGAGGAGALGDAGLRTVTGALAALPGLPGSGEESETVLWGDMARAAEIAGVERPDDPGDTDALVDYIQVLTNGRVDAGTTAPVLVLPPEAAGLDRASEHGAFADEVGWSILDVDRFAERQTAPDVVTVLEGDLDEDTLTEALGEPSDGLWVAGDPDHDDFELDVADRTAARPLGETLWLGLDGDQLAVARSRTSAEAAVGGSGSSGGQSATLADDETFAALATALDAEDPYAAMLVRPGLSIDPAAMGATPAQLEALCEAALPETTTGVAAGIGDDGGPVYLVALAHRSPDAASANAEALEEMVARGTSLATGGPWSDVVTLDGVEITGDDRVVVARLRPTESRPPALWYQLVAQRESLVSHC